MQCVSVSMPAQSNALTASIFFIGTIISDCLTAIDSTDHADVPSSLRGTSLVLVCCFAAPVLIRPERGVYGWFQRPIIFVALAAAAFLGIHHGGQATRTFDAFFTTIVCLAVTWLFSAGGLDEQTKRIANGESLDRAVSTSSAMLSGSLLLYSNMRILRSGLRHASEVRNFRISPTGMHNASATISTLGYAYSSDVATFAVTAGGAVGIGAAITMVYHVTELASGTGTVALQLGVSATYQLLAALTASLTFGEQVNWLPAVFGNTACRGDADVCAAAAMSRRFASVNTQLAGLWLSSLGLFCLAYPPSARLFDRGQAARFTWSLSGSIFGVAAILIALAVVWVYSDFAGVGGHTDYVILISLFSIFWSTFFDKWAGTLLYVVAFFVEEVLYVYDFGYETLFSHLTHVTLLFCAALLVLHLVLTSVAFFWTPKWLEIVIGMVTVAGSSLAVALYCAAACLVMASNGGIAGLEDIGNGSRTAISFILQHFLPVFIWAPLYTCRCEVQLLSSLQRLLTWFVVVPLNVIAYVAVLAVLNKTPPTAVLIDSWGLLGCALGAGILPWIAASSV